MSRILDFTIAGAQREHLKVRVSGRERPDSTDSDDGNWLQASVEVRAGRFGGTANRSLRTDDIAEFRKGLARLTDDCNATANFKTMGDLLAITVSTDGSGRLAVTGHICDDVVGNRLSFKLDADRGELPGVLQSLDKILEEYPVR